jgi:hypothetical protein
LSAAKDGPSLGDIVAGAAFAVGLISAWLYVAGWTYAYHYFDRFRIPLLLVELPREHLFVYGGLTLWKNFVWTIVGATVAAGLVVLAVALRRPLGRLGLTGMTVLGVIVLFALARAAGVTTAQADFLAQRASDYAAYPRVTVTLAQDAAPVDRDDQALAIAMSGCARLLLFNDERLFLIRPVKGAPGVDLHTFVLPWSDVAALRITDQYTSCD